MERKMTMEIKIANTNGKPTVSSIQVAKDFEKEHKNVIQTIKNLTAENSAVKDMFIENTYFTERGRQYKCYEITRDGFSLLVMGFTGKKDFKGFGCFGLSLWNGNDYSDKTLINESGVYSLIIGSKLESVKRFKRWITSEAFPSLRKYGSYSIVKPDSYMIEDKKCSPFKPTENIVNILVFHCFVNKLHNETV